MIETTLENYQQKFLSLIKEIRYVDQQRATLVEQALKMQGAIEALKNLEPENDVETWYFYQISKDLVSTHRPRSLAHSLRTNKRNRFPMFASTSTRRS